MERAEDLISAAFPADGAKQVQLLTVKVESLLLSQDTGLAESVRGSPTLIQRYRCNGPHVSHIRAVLRVSSTQHQPTVLSMTC